MKVLHVTSGSLSGGAAQGALRLHEGLLEIGVESFIYTDDASGVEGVNIIDGKGIINRAKRYVNYKFNEFVLKKYACNVFFSVGNEILNTLSIKRVEDFDIINLHWINYSLKLETIRQLSKKNTVVWTVRDMWLLTGGCHYSLQCSKYQDGCYQCPLIGNNKFKDVTHGNLVKKKDCTEDVNFVVISKWLQSQAQKSVTLSNKNISLIYNCIDFEVFKPNESINEKPFLDMRKNKKIKVLIGAQNLKSSYKGGRYLKEFVEEASDEFFFIFFGNGTKELCRFIENDNYYDFGFVNDQNLLSAIYSVADIFLMLSEQEAFGKTVIESLACGTPVVAFKGTAPGEILDLVEPEGSIDKENFVSIFSSIRKILRSYDPQATRSKCIQYFSKENIAKKYLDLYKSLR